MKVIWQSGIIVAGAVCLGYLLLRPGSDSAPPPLRSAEELRVLAIEGDEEMRFHAVNDLSAGNNLDEIPLLLKAMNDESPRVRGRAGAAVRRLFGGADFHFDANMPAKDRAELIKWLQVTYESAKKNKDLENAEKSKAENK